MIVIVGIRIDGIVGMRVGEECACIAGPSGPRQKLRQERGYLRMGYIDDAIVNWLATRVAFVMARRVLINRDDCKRGARRMAVVLGLAALLAPVVRQPALADGTLPLPTQMRVCTVEPVRWNPCGVWTLDKGRYDGVWADIHLTALITVDRFTLYSVEFTRRDQGSHAGVYRYRGRPSSAGGGIDQGEVSSEDGRLLGHFTASWNDPALAAALRNAALERKVHPISGLPPVMHFCAANCFTLELRGNQYVATNQYPWAGVNFSSTWTVDQFGSDRVVIHRQDSSGYSGENTWSAEFDGHISNTGNHLVDVQVNGKPEPDIRWSWGSALEETPGSNEERDRLRATQGSIAGASADISSAELHDRIADIASQSNAARVLTQGPPQVRLPPGAAPAFASFRADVRAVLQPESPLLPEHRGLACDAGNSLGDVEALEVAKFAFRAMDFARGICWSKALAHKSNSRADVLLGVAALMGWGSPKDLTAAYDHFNAAAKTNDPWGVYFLEDCYHYGWGTPVDLAMTQHLDSWLMANPDGQAVFRSIGADDAESERQYRRMMVLFDPPRTSNCYKDRDGKLFDCHPGDVDQAALQQRLDDINGSR